MQEKRDFMMVRKRITIAFSPVSIRAQLIHLYFLVLVSFGGKKNNNNPMSIIIPGGCCSFVGCHDINYLNDILMMTWCGNVSNTLKQAMVAQSRSSFIIWH